MGRILITTRSVADCETAIRMMQAEGHEIAVHIGKGNMDEKEFSEAIKGANALIVGVDPVTRKVISAGVPDLKVIVRNGVGYNNVDLECAAQYGIPVSIAPGASTVSVCELALGMMFSAARHISEQNWNVKTLSWKRQMGFELAGKTLGVVGCGNIGSEVAVRAAALGMKVLVYDIRECRRIKELSGTEYVELAYLLQEADIITLHLPVTESTSNLVDRNFLEQVKTGAILINTARGKLVDELEIAKALEDGRLGCYATDTLAEEPIKSNNPLLRHPNTIITPHCGAYTKEAVERCGVIVAEEVNRVLKGEAPLNSVSVPVSC